MQLSPLVVAVALVGALEPHKLNGLVKNRKKLENFARGVSPHINPPVPLTAIACPAPAGTFAGRNATRHATHVYEMATYVNSINVLRGGAH